MRAKNFDLKHFLRAHDILPEAYICVGVSGGVDSMVLLSLLAEAHPVKNIVVLHVNHLLRGEESNLDEALVRKIASTLGVSFEWLRADVGARAKAGKISLETAGREIRRGFFEKSAQKYGAQGVFLAHHKNDQAETILRNFVKGSRLRGLSGMHESDGFYFRPLLGLSKSDIVEFAREHGIVWREDASNGDCSYERNLMRNEIFPILRELNPSIESTLSGFGDFSRELSDFFDSFLEDTLSKKSIEVFVFDRLGELLQKMAIERMFAKSQGGSTIGLSAGNIEEIQRYILTANGGTEKTVGWLRMTKKQNRVFWE